MEAGASHAQIVTVTTAGRGERLCWKFCWWPPRNASSFADAVVATPADVVKTRLMDQAGGRQRYAGMLDAAARIMCAEGVGALYAGFCPIVVRKVAWCSLFFVTYERIRSGL